MKTNKLLSNIKNYFVGALSRYDAERHLDDKALQKAVSGYTKAIDAGKADFIVYSDRGCCYLDLG